MLKWMLILVGALLGLVVLIALVGLALPRGHVARSSIVLDQPADTVWAVIRDLAGYPDWWPYLKAVERLPDRDGREVWRHRDRQNQEITIEVLRSEPPTRLVTRIADENLPFGGSWSYEIRLTSSGTRISVTEDGEVYNPLFRFMSRFVFGHHATLESYLRALAARFGSAATPTRSPQSPGAER